MVEALVQQLLDGLTVGMVYALLASGLSVIFGVMNVINFAHGELFGLGAYFALAVVSPLGGVGFYLALLVAPLIVGGIGVLIERFTVRPLYDRNPLYHILLTFGLVLIISDLVILVWGPEPTSLSRPEFITGTFDALGGSFSRYAVFMIVFGSIVTAGVWAVLNYTGTDSSSVPVRRTAVWSGIWVSISTSTTRWCLVLVPRWPPSPVLSSPAAARSPLGWVPRLSFRRS